MMEYFAQPPSPYTDAVVGAFAKRTGECHVHALFSSSTDPPVATDAIAFSDFFCVCARYGMMWEEVGRAMAVVMVVH